MLAPAPRPQDVLALPAHAQETQVGATPVALAHARPSIDVRPPTHAREAYNPVPILPPRPTGRMRAAGDDRGWLARNWPIAVIILASLAIVLAVILMVWPASEQIDVGVKNHGAGPAPERMETNPLPPPSGDPWQNGQPPSGNTAPVPPPPDDPDDQTMIDPGDPLRDPFSSPRPGRRGGGGLGGTLGGGNNIGFVLLGNIANRLCDKAKSCSDPSITTMCSSMSAFPVSPLPSNCPQAARCMEIIDQIDVCDGSLSSLGGTNFPQIMMRTSDCMEALTAC